MEILVSLTQGQSLPYRKMVLAPRDGMVMATTAFRPQSIQKMSFQKMAHARPGITQKEIIVLNHKIFREVCTPLQHIIYPASVSK